ncbi:MAG: invasion associated locus B family protein [Pseudomonadota bacterium]
MTSCTMRKALFTLTGLALVTFLVLVGRSHYVEASPKEGQKFEDWTVTCTKENKKEVCFLSQALSSKENPEQRVAEFRVGYFGDKTLKMIQLLPFGVMLQSGTSIISDDKLIAPGKFTTCQPVVGCIAVSELNKESLDTVLKSTANSVGLLTIEGQQINVVFSNKGLKEGIDSLK